MQLYRCENGRKFLIIGAGKSILDYKDKIKAFIEKHDPVTIGINKITDIFIPKYHVWTNRQRWGAFGECTSEKSILLVGKSITDNAIKKKYNGTINRIDYVDAPNTPIQFKENVIYGFFRTAGVLSIMIAHVMGSSEIYIVGMDGYTLHSENDLKENKHSHHCYGKGYTDDADWKKCVLKDRQVDLALHDLATAGVEFSIITPTKFKDFYKSGII